MAVLRAAEARLRPRPRNEDDSAHPIELFFDLVFVFALTQVTAAMADDLSVVGMVRGFLVVALLWWAWVAYSWLANVVRADEGVVKLVLLVSMGAMLVITLAVPEAFEDLPGGLHGPTVLALGYLVFRLLHIVLYWFVAAGDQGLRRQLLRFLPSVLGATAVLLVAARLEGTLQVLAWLAALAVDYGGTYLAGASGWRLPAPPHFAERHGLIVIVALGESIVAIGVGIAELPVSLPIVVGAVLGLTLAGALWWVYFDFSQPAGERALAGASGAERTRLARDAYTYWHLPLVAGIVVLALGVKKVLEYGGDPEHHAITDPVDTVALVGLCGGVALYLLAHVGFAWRTTHDLLRARVVGAVLALLVIPLGMSVPALASLALVAAIVVGVAAFETVRWSERRDAIRHAADGDGVL